MKFLIILAVFGLSSIMCSCSTSKDIPQSITSNTDHLKSEIREKRDITIDGRIYPYIKYIKNPSLGEITILKIKTADENLIFPNSIEGLPVKEIAEKEYSKGYAVIEGKDKYKKIIVPEGVERVNPFSFQKATAEEIELPQSLSTIGESAFYESQIKKVKVKSKNIDIKLEAFSYSKLKKISFPDEFEGTFGNGCFEHTDIESIQWPKQRENSMDSVVRGTAFGWCTNLKEVQFPEEQDVITIPIDCFYGCRKLAKLEFPASTKKVVYQPFAYADNNQKAGPEEIVLLGKDTQLEGGETGKGQILICAKSIALPRESVALSSVKKIVRPTWLSESQIKDADEHGSNYSYGKGDIKYGKINYRFIK